MGMVGALFGFGLALIAGGLFWSIIDDIIASHFTVYISNTSDPYYLVCDLIWHSLPFLIIIVGILCLIVAGAISRGTKKVSYE